MNKYLKLARIHHYIKNFFVFLPLFFSFRIFELPMLSKVTLGFIAFSFFTSIVYIVNDIRDVEKDRLHPKKCKRPIASGEISKKKAKIFAVILFMAATVFLIVACRDAYMGYVFVFTYFALNIFYSFGGKNIPIIDVAILASGFLIRLLFGAVICSVEISNWLYLTVIAISFFLALGKRRNELLIGKETRAVLKYYSYEYLDKMMYMFMSVAIVFYSLWCVDPITSARFASTNIIWTVPLVILVCMRYSLLIEGNTDGDPVDVILHDKILMALVALYGAVTLSMMYLSR